MEGFGNNEKRPDPSEDEIKQICKNEIQPRWSKQERRKRAGKPKEKEHWTPPLVCFRDLEAGQRQAGDKVYRDEE